MQPPKADTCRRPDVRNKARWENEAVAAWGERRTGHIVGGDVGPSPHRCVRQLRPDGPTKHHHLDGLRLQISRAAVVLCTYVRHAPHAYVGDRRVVRQRMYRGMHPQDDVQRNAEDPPYFSVLGALGSYVERCTAIGRSERGSISRLSCPASYALCTPPPCPTKFPSHPWTMHPHAGFLDRLIAAAGMSAESPGCPPFPSHLPT